MCVCEVWKCDWLRGKLCGGPRRKLRMRAGGHPVDGGCCWGGFRGSSSAFVLALKILDSFYCVASVTSGGSLGN